MMKMFYVLMSLHSVLLCANPETSCLPAILTNSAPTIDGQLIESVWKSTMPATDFVQYEPFCGAPSTTNIEAMVTYDSSRLFIAFRVWEPGSITAQLTSRDAALLNDDAVILVLDTYFDRQTAYYFIVNAIGTQLDGRIINDGQGVDDTWDAPWQAAVVQTDYGWSAELAIPFTSLKYKSVDSQSWGINFGRTRHLTFETSFWTGPLNDIYQVSQAGTLSDLIIPKPDQQYQIIAYGLSQIKDDSKVDKNIGFDLRYNISSQFSSYFTLNPDFATIEADQTEINLTRFELSLSEKRPFFIEGNELYKQRIRTFYSRRIPDISTGLKILSKMNSWTLSALTAQSNIDTISNIFSVGRLQRDIHGNSNIGLMLANRHYNNSNDGSVGIDGNLYFSDSFGMTTQIIKSYGLFSTGTWAYFVRPAFDTPTKHFHVRYSDIGKNFADNVNRIGFIRDDNRKELDAAVEKIFWIRGNKIERIQYDSNYNIYWGQSGNLRSWEVEQSFEIEFASRFSFELGHDQEMKRYEKDFHNYETKIEFGYNTRELQSISTSLEFGKNYEKDYHLISAQAGYKPMSELSLEYEFQHLVLNPDPDNEKTWIHLLKMNHYFTKDIYLKVFYQSDLAENKEDIQVVFVYRYQPPFGVVQLAFQRAAADFLHNSNTGNAVLLKATKVF
ncbi:MAG: carbohydrate binding family 9 domain-containing protein [Candidatus Marinimicrobia bacterium]|nr:carbohydrate binding family 9 domain-containing protein [Candidatus Neomarinimicrobiota bacterium]